MYVYTEYDIKQLKLYPVCPKRNKVYKRLKIPALNDNSISWLHQERHKQLFECRKQEKTQSKEKALAWAANKQQHKDVRCLCLSSFSFMTAQFQVSAGAQKPFIKHDDLQLLNKSSVNKAWSGLFIKWPITHTILSTLIFPHKTIAF